MSHIIPPSHRPPRTCPPYNTVLVVPPRSSRPSVRGGERLAGSLRAVRPHPLSLSAAPSFRLRLASLPCLLSVPGLNALSSKPSPIDLTNPKSLVPYIWCSQAHFSNCAGRIRNMVLRIYNLPHPPSLNLSFFQKNTARAKQIHDVVSKYKQAFRCVVVAWLPVQKKLNTCAHR